MIKKTGWSQPDPEKGAAMRNSTLTKGSLTRQKIVAAAAPIFNQRGYEGSSLSALMAATGLKKGGIYRHFSGKEELAAEAFDYTWAAARDARLKGLDGQGSSVERLKRFIANFANYRSAVPGGCPVMNTAVDADDGNPLLRARAQKALKFWLSRLRTIVRQGIESGEIRPDVDAKAVATLIVATLEGALMMSRLAQSRSGGTGRKMDALRGAQRHLNQYLDRDVAVDRQPSSGIHISTPSV